MVHGNHGKKAGLGATLIWGWFCDRPAVSAGHGLGRGLTQLLFERFREHLPPFSLASLKPLPEHNLGLFDGTERQNRAIQQLDLYFGAAFNGIKNGLGADLGMRGEEEIAEGLFFNRHGRSALNSSAACAPEMKTPGGVASPLGSVPPSH